MKDGNKGEILIERLFTLINTSEVTENGHRINRFIDEIPGGFLIYRADGNEEILYANKALIHILGCETYEEFIELTGNSFRGLVHPDDLDAVEKSISEQIESNCDDLDYVEYRITRKDGVVRWVEDYGHFVKTEFIGDIYYVFITDATEKITRRLVEKHQLIKDKFENEKKLQHLKEEYDKERNLIRQEDLQRLEVIQGLSVNYESILYVDFEADKVLAYRMSGRVKTLFDAHNDVYAFSEFVKDYVDERVFPEDMERVRNQTEPEYIRRRLMENSTFYINFRCLENNETIYLQLRMVDVSGGSATKAVMGYRRIDEEVLQEMKQKRLLEEALHTAKLADVAKNAFLSNMSHDMRTPLNAIFGYISLARNNLKNPEVLADYLNNIELAGKNILELTEKVLEISYNESQEFKVSEDECNLGEILEEVHKSVLPRAQRKRVTINLINSARRNMVYADGEKLVRALLYIANNAVKYNKTGGNVDIVLEEGNQSPEGFVAYRFIVKDTGIGIRKETLDHIFEPFERETNTTMSKEYGTGLGLTIAKHLIEMMGGNISVESTVGKGSCFTVSISFRTVNDKAEDDGRDDIDLTGKKILLVEDNEINLEIETEILSDLGFIVDTAENGKIAVDKVRASRSGEYEFILMDIQMPVMDGIQAATEIRKLGNKKIAEVPIIALSANAFDSDKRLSLKAGMDAHLAKPIDIPALLKTVKDVLYERKNLS